MKQNGEQPTQIDDAPKEAFGQESSYFWIGLRKFEQFIGEWSSWSGSNQKVVPVGEANEFGTKKAK